MRIRMGDLRLSIKEAIEAIKSPEEPGRRKMAFEALLSLQQQLDERLATGELSGEEYDNEWDDVLHAAGWTRAQYERELDRRWDYMDVLRGIVPSNDRPN